MLLQDTTLINTMQNPVQDTTITIPVQNPVQDTNTVNRATIPQQDTTKVNSDDKLAQDSTKEYEYEKTTMFRYSQNTTIEEKEKSLFRMNKYRRSTPFDYKFGDAFLKTFKEYDTPLQADSTGEKLMSRETFDSVDVSYPYEITLDKYLRLRQYNLRLGIWDSMLTSYDLNRALSGGDIARMISQATGFSIPIPQNPLMGIFGKPEISLNVSGEVNLRLGYRWDSQNLGTVSSFGQTPSSPMFSQDIRVNVSGKIGDKFVLGTDWSTNKTFDYQNTFKIGYEGYDDDIIKLVEVGNVSLPLQTSLIRGGEALFGVRADFQFGPLYLKTLFTQKRGERKYVDVKGGASKQPFYLRAYDYAKNHFFLDTLYKVIYRDYFKNSTPIIPPNAAPLRVKEIEVWESTNNLTDIHSVEGVAYADLQPKKLRLKPVPETYPPDMKNAVIVSGITERGRFIRLDSSRYDIDLNLGTLNITNLRQDRTYAVAYRTEAETPAVEDDNYYGNLSTFSDTKDTLIFKLIYRPNLQPQFKLLWDRQMKNIYSINASRVNLSETKINVWYINKNNDSADVLEGAPDKLVTILKVDQVNNSTGSAPPDGQFDMQPPFFDAYSGEITFPNPEPFGKGLVEYFAKLGNSDLAQNYTFSEVYDTTYDVARRNTARDRFVISGEVSGSGASNRISLGAFNLAPNSVRVTLDGRQLREFEDYVVDYYAGTLTMKNQRAALPNANLKIEYEQHDVFNISTRTLAGIRGDYLLLKTRKADANIGFTTMLYDQSVVVDRVRLGDEPVSNSILGFDGRFNMDAQFITDALDWLPFFDTKTPSTIAFKGETAVILPEPNKQQSEIASDGGLPVVYLDDFEGAQRYISLGLNPTQWTHCSPPADSSIAAEDSIKALYRGKMFWFQYFIPRIPIQEVYPNRSITVGHSNLSPLEIRFAPEFRGIYNKNPQYLDSLNPNYDPSNAYGKQPENRQRIWGGIMKLFSSFNTNFDTENIEYIEIMMRILPPFDYQQTQMFIDLGQITEDMIPNGKLDTEDGIGENPVPNNIIDVGEDREMDALFTSDEKNSANIPFPLNLEADPSRDDYAFDFSKDDRDRVPEDFYRYNNYEGNSQVSEAGQFPDTEILNRNNGQTLSTDNSYFSYEVVLDSDPSRNTQIVGGGNSGWALWRIPVRKPNKIVGNPSYSNIQYIKVWFKGGDGYFQIADWKLVGSQWQRTHNLQANVPSSDSVLKISFVNREENSGAPDYYTLPPGVEPPKMIGSDDQTRIYYLNEQSISVSVRNLVFGDERMTARFARPMDLYYYEKLKFFVHGDGSMPDFISPNVTPKAESFLRFGIDSANYYEYRRPLIKGWQDVEIEMSDLTSLKSIRDSALIYDRYEIRSPRDSNARLIIKGNPILTKVQFFALGIANPAERFPNRLTTTMWVDELRLIKPDESADWGAVTSLDIKLADLGSVNFSYQQVEPNFHQLEQRFGDRNNSSNWSFSIQAGLEKFAPKGFRQMKVPISYTHSEYVINPLFVANNDINLNNAASLIEQKYIDNGYTADEAKYVSNELKRRSQTVKVMDSWALTGVQLGIPVDHWLIKETLNRLEMGYSYSQEFERSPVVEERFRWIWKLMLKYGLTLPKLDISPMVWAKDVFLFDTYSGMKINLLPNNFSTSLAMARSRTTEQSRFLDVPSPVFRDFSAITQMQFSWKFVENGFINPTYDYSVTSGNSLVKLEFDQYGNSLSGREIADNIFVSNGRLIYFGDNTAHSQNTNLNFAPRLPNIAGLGNHIDMSGSFNTTYNWMNPLQPDPSITDIAKVASTNNTIRFGMGIKLKSAADKWYGTSGTKPGSIQSSAPGDSLGNDVFSGFLRVIKTIFLDFDKIQLDFNQTNSSMDPGVYGSNGFSNYWEGMAFMDGDYQSGPSFPYQLGLVGDPHGSFNMHWTNSFPYVGFTTSPGLRPPNAVLQDIFTQTSNFTISTNRPLWDGATLDLRWSSTFAFNKTQTLVTDAFGNPFPTNIISLKSLNRSYLAIPSVFGIDIGGTMEDVVNEYNTRAAEIDNSGEDELKKNLDKQNALSESFYETFEIFSFAGGDIGRYLPAINWGIRWEGLERWGIWGGIAKRISFEHRYLSQYQEVIQYTDNGRTVPSQQIQYGFQPLFGFTMGFDEKKLNGNLTASVKYNTQTQYQLMSSNHSAISRNSVEEFTVQASYLMRGWEFPLLGFNFKNDIEFSFMGSFKMNKRASYDIVDPGSYEGSDNKGRVLDGNQQITIEPRARYTISNRLTASFFFRYEGTFTEGAATPGFSTTQVGLDIRLSIAGGR